MLFSGYICNERFKRSSGASRLRYKEATNQSLNQKSRCFYIGAFVFSAGFSISMRRAAFTHATHEHFHLLYDITSRQLDVWNDNIFQAYGVAAVVANEVNMIIPVFSTGTILPAQRITYRIIRSGYTVDQAFFEKCLQRAVNGNAVEFLARFFFDIAV